MLNVVMLSVVMLIVAFFIMLSVIMMNVVRLIVMAPSGGPELNDLRAGGGLPSITTA